MGLLDLVVWIGFLNYLESTHHRSTCVKAIYRQGSSTLLCALFPFGLVHCHTARLLQAYSSPSLALTKSQLFESVRFVRCCNHRSSSLSSPRIFSLFFWAQTHACARPPSWCRLSACEVLLACSPWLDVRHIDQSFASVLCASIVSSKSGRGGFSAQKQLFFLSCAFLFSSSRGLKSHLLYRLCWNFFFLSFLSSSWICIFLHELSKILV